MKIEIIKPEDQDTIKHIFGNIGHVTELTAETLLDRAKKDEDAARRMMEAAMKAAEQARTAWEEASECLFSIEREMDSRERLLENGRYRGARFMREDLFTRYERFAGGNYSRRGPTALGPVIPKLPNSEVRQRFMAIFDQARDHAGTSFLRMARDVLTQEELFSDLVRLKFPGEKAFALLKYRNEYYIVLKGGVPGNVIAYTREGSVGIYGELAYDSLKNEDVSSAHVLESSLASVHSRG